MIDRLADRPRTREPLDDAAKGLPVPHAARFAIIAHVRRIDAAAAAVFIVLSLAMTWPLALNPDRAVADPGDPYLNVWILDWDQFATFHAPLHLFDANAFHPARWVLAFSENLYGIALLLIPVRLAGASPITAYNLALLAGFAFSGLAAYILGKTVTKSAAAGMAAGIFYAFVPYRFTHVVHIQHVWGGWLPLTLAALLHYDRAPSRRRAALFALLFLMNGLTNIHLLLFGSVALLLTLPFLKLFPWRRWVPLAVASACAALLLLPFLWPYQRAASTYGMIRSRDEAASYSASPADWLKGNALNPLHRQLHDAGRDPELWLFPGAAGVVLALAGAITAAKRDRRILAIALVWIALGFFGSLGLHTLFHRFLFDHLPGFRAIRVPARWSMIAYVGMAMMIAQAACSSRRRWLAAAVAIVLMAELWPAHIRWYLAPRDHPAVYEWLASNDIPGGVLELPLSRESSYVYLLRATRHHRPILNGTSGFAPPAYEALSSMLHSATIPDGTYAQLLRRDCSLLLVHADFIDGETRRWLIALLDRGEIHLFRRFDGGVRGDWLFALRDGRFAALPGTEAELGAALAAFRNDSPTYNAGTFGLLDPPQPSKGGYWFAGYAFSPAGVRGVDLLFEQGTVRIPAILFEDHKLSSTFPWYPTVTKPRFLSSLVRRPHGIRRDTDVQVEILDGDGRRTLLDDRFLRWDDQGEGN